MINFSQEVYMVVSRSLVSLGSFLCSVAAGRSSVAMRMSIKVRREVLGPGLPPFGSLAMITFVGGMFWVQCSLVWRCVVSRLFQLCSPSSHRGQDV